jgi:hypothetical protein
LKPGISAAGIELEGGAQQAARLVQIPLPGHDPACFKPQLCLSPGIIGILETLYTQPFATHDRPHNPF